MSGTVLVRGARQLITLRGSADPRRGAALQELGIIRDGALLIENGRIAQVGLSRRVENLVAAKRCEEIDATGRVVMPGFVDCHAHLVWNTLPPRDADSSGASTPEREPAIRALRHASAKRLESRARQYVDGMIRHGTTWLEARTGVGLDMRSEMKVLRVHAKLDGAPLNIVSTYSLPQSVPTARAGNSGSYNSWICSELLPAVRLKTSASFACLSCGETALLADSRRYLQAARGLGFQIKIDAAAGAAGDAVRLALETGAVSVDDLRDAGPVETQALARSSTMAVLLPAGAFQHVGAWSSARGLIDEGAAVALGTNFNPGVGPTFSMMATIALACTYLGMTPAEAISAATFNAACAIGVTSEAGSLEVGKPADLIVLNASDYHEIDSYLGVNLVHRTVKKGVTVYQEGAVIRRLPVTTEPASRYTDRS